MPTGVFCVVGVELRDRHDAVVELDAEHGLRDGTDVAHGLLRGLALVGEHVDLDRPAGPVADDPDGVDAGEPAELVLELAELRPPIGRRSASSGDNSSFAHSLGIATPSSRGPAAPATDTAYGQPTTLRGPSWLLMLLVGLALRAGSGETDRVPRAGRAEATLGGGNDYVSGWRRQGLGLTSNEQPEAKRQIRRAHSDAQTGEQVSGGLVKKTMVRVAAGASALVAMLLAGGAVRTLGS